MDGLKRERRDWAVFFVFLLLGIILMLIASQFAISLVSHWNVTSDMDSKLDPNQDYSNYRQVGVYAPLRPEILTPPPWGSTFLTPQPGIGLTLYPNFIFSPSQTPSGPTPVVSPIVGVSSTAPGMSTSTSAPNSTSTPIVIIIGSTSTQVPAPTKPPSDTSTPIPSMPEIVVEGLGAVNIADGGTYDLGSTTIFTPLTRTITVRNTGTATLNLLTNPPTITGNFAATNFGSTSLAAGTSTSFDLTCNATGLGSPVSGTVSFSNNDSDENPFDFTVTCAVTILPAPEIVVEGPVSGNITDGGTYDLGTTTLSTPLIRTITVRNTGTANLNLTAPLTVTGDFSITSFALPITVTPGASTTFNLICNATTLGAPVSGTISFSNNDGDENPFNFTITCTVNAPEIVVEDPGAANIADGSTYNMGTTTVGAPLVQTITVRNTGTAPLNLLLTEPTVTSGFTVTHFVSTSVAASASTTFDLTCNASVSGSFSGTVSFSNNDSDENPFNFTITCTVNAPEIVVEDSGAANIADGSTYNMGTTTVGAPLVQTITVRNTGTATLNLLTDPPMVPAGFTASNFGTTSVAASGATTTFTLKCIASAPGSFSGTVSFDNNDSDENHFNFTVNCTVNTPPEIVVEAPVAGNIVDGIGTYDLGATVVGASLTRTITVRNTGMATLNLTNPTVSGDFVAGPFGATSLDTGESTTFDLQCNASAPGAPVSGTVSFSNNDSDGGDGVEDPFNFTVNCTVTVAPPPLPSAINIGVPNTVFYTVTCTSEAFTISPPISTGLGLGFDFVYYERWVADIGIPFPGLPGIIMDQVQVEISADNSTWYKVLDWGDGNNNANTNIAGLPAAPPFSLEDDNFPIRAATSLYNNSGIEINIDGIVPPGSYPYIRITDPNGCGGDGAEIDAIELLH